LDFLTMIPCPFSAINIFLQALPDLPEIP